MTLPRTGPHPRFTHDVLIHDDDAGLFRATRLFVQRGLATGANVLVHSSRERVAALQDELGVHPQLAYGYDDEMYLSPMKTLFAYQAQLAERNDATEVWVTGTVPVGSTAGEQAAWLRYESAVNEALKAFPFRALCTYDARMLPATVVEAARAAHPTVGTGLTSVPCAGYLAPSDYLDAPMALRPRAPATEPQLVVEVRGLADLVDARRAVERTAQACSAVSLDAVGDLVLAVHEVTANGVVHGAAPVRLSVWAEVSAIAVEVVDSGPGGLDPMTGYSYPDASKAAGLWAARQQVTDLFIDTVPEGGCRVLLLQSEAGT